MHRVVFALAVVSLTTTGCFGPECSSLMDCPEGSVCSAEGACVAHEAAPGATARGFVTPLSAGLEPALGEPVVVDGGAVMDGALGMFTSLSSQRGSVYVDGIGGGLQLFAELPTGTAFVFLFAQDLETMLATPGRYSFDSTIFNPALHAQACADEGDVHYDEAVSGTIEVGAELDNDEVLGAASERAGAISLRVAVTAVESDVVIEAVVPALE